MLAMKQVDGWKEKLGTRLGVQLFKKVLTEDKAINMQVCLDQESDPMSGLGKHGVLNLRCNWNSHIV